MNEQNSKDDYSEFNSETIGNGCLGGLLGAVISAIISGGVFALFFANSFANNLTSWVVIEATLQGGLLGFSTPWLLNYRNVKQKKIGIFSLVAGLYTIAWILRFIFPLKHNDLATQLSVESILISFGLFILWGIVFIARGLFVIFRKP